MALFAQNPFFVGVESSKESLKLIALRQVRKGFEIALLKEISKESSVNPLYTIPKNSMVISALASRDILIRNLEIPAKKKEDVLRALEFQIEPLLPFPIDSAVVCGDIMQTHKSGASVTAFAVKKLHIQKHLEDMPLIPEKITCIPYALTSLSKILGNFGTTFLVHIGEEEITCALVFQGQLLASRAFDKGLDLEMEMEKTLLKLAATHKEKPFDSCYLLGDSSYAQKIQSTTGKTVLFPSSPFLALSQEEFVRYGLCIGIALSHCGIDFRVKEFTYPHPFKRLKKPVIFSLLLSLLLCSIVFLMARFSLTNQKNQVKEAFKILMGQEGQDHAPFPKTPSSYLNALNSFEKSFALKPDTYPLYPQIPKVKEILSWLSLMSESLGEKLPIVINTFHYTLVKKPDFTHKTEHYKVKVIFEFYCENPHDARAFHEILLKPNAFIDSKEEFKWTASKGKYTAEFFLKDKTRYQ